MKNYFLLLFIAVTCHTGLFAQRTATGRVLDNEGYGIPSAGVSVKGNPDIGTVTDVEGNFSLDVPVGRDSLVIRAVGFNAQTVHITGSPLTVRMSRESTELQETVVTALAVKREKREIGYSATTLNDDELNAGNNTSALSAIQGKTAGVNITSTTGGPGGSTRIVMRGEKSITGNNNALIVVDGIIVNNTARLSDGSDIREQVDFGNRGNDIPPEDIASITVLKGPAAAALYGAAGANGAIMITTKRGRNRKEGPSKTEISYQSNYTFHSVLKLPEFQNKYGEGNVNDVPTDRRENFSWGLPFDSQLRPWGQEIYGRQKVKPYEAIKDNVKNFFNTGHTWENNVSISGGDAAKSGYYLSVNTLNNTGVIPNTFYDKYSIRFNGNTQLSNKFYSSISLNYMDIRTRVETQGQATGSVYDNVLQTPRDIPISELKNYSNDVFSSMQYTDTSGVSRYGYYGAYTANPYWVADSFDNRSYTDRVLGALILGYKPNSHWDIFNRFGGDVTSDRYTFKYPKFDVLPFDEFYDGLSHSLLGGYRESHINSMFFYNDLIAQYNKQLSENLGMNVLLGQNVTLSHLMSNDASINPNNNGLVVPGYYNLANANGPITASNRTEDRRLVGLYSSFRLDYRRALFLELTARNDWTSTLIRGNNSYFYPSANVSWVFTETLKDKSFTDVLTYGKLRANFASVGNDAPVYLNNDPGYLASIVQTNFGTTQFPLQYSGGSVPGYTFENILGQRLLRPERTNSWEVGAELAFWASRLTLDAAYYNQYTVDQIITVPLPPSTGFTGIPVNLGDISNQGVELSLRGTPVFTRTGFKWELFGTFTKNVNKVTRLSQGVSQVVLGGLSGMAITATVGKPYGAFFATDLAKDPQGRVIVDSATGLPQLTTTSVYKGSYQPRFIASWGTTLSYKGFTLNVLFDTKQGGVFYSRTKSIMDFVGTAKETENREDHVFPNSVYQSANGNYVVNTDRKYSPYSYFTSVIPDGQHVLDASYVKLREASLYYNLPKKWFTRTPIGLLRVGVYGSNLFVWTSKENKYVDPEMNSGGSSNIQGIDFTARPSLRNYGFSLRVTF